MTKERARKRKIRSRMATTGERFSVAARNLAGNSYMRSTWSGSDWIRLLPSQAMILEFAICTATVNESPGTLEQILKSYPAQSREVPQGPHTPLTWSHDADEETRSLGLQAAAAFHAALIAMGKSVPATVGELAWLLVELGVYQHKRDSDGVHWWQADTDLPTTRSVLPLPPEWVAHEDKVHWKITTSGPAFVLSDHLRARGRPSMLSTTIDQLAADINAPVRLVRHALDGMAYRCWVVVQRHNSAIERDQLQRLPGHSRFVLEVDWTLMDDGYTADTDEEDEGEPSEIRWMASPWAVYRSIAQDPNLGRNELKALAQIPFRQKTPDGGSRYMTLEDLASVQRMSTDTAVKSLCELERKGLFTWNVDQQCFEAWASKHGPNFYDPGNHSRAAGTVSNKAE